MTDRPLNFGECVANRHLNSSRNPRFAFGSVAGRYVLVLVVFDLAAPVARAALDIVDRAERNEAFRLATILCCDPRGRADERMNEIARERLLLWDEQQDAARAWRLLPDALSPAGCFVLLDPALRVISRAPIDQAAAMLELFGKLPDPDLHAGVPLSAPVLIVPRIFEPSFCAHLIEQYQKMGGEESGTTRENDEGKTYVALDPTFKRRSDWVIDDPALRRSAMQRVYWRLLAEIEKAFQFRCTRMERYIVACYDAASGGYFRPHRDNTTKGTAHRRFAVTINLNAEDYEGGDLRFPEFGRRAYRAPTGGAIVFSCSLLHEATPVSRGKRYAFLPFLYDEAAASVREANSPYLDDALGSYKKI